ncbi:MAG: hypothetical protein HQ582_25735, partial [Planctomycetes bacterium]|nr:hypothetical protein [Planctomycetota bacterium]
MSLSQGSDKPMLVGIALMLVFYVALLAIGLPQQWARDAAAGHSADAEASGEPHASAETAVEEHGAAEHGLAAKVEPPPLWT